MMTPGWPKAPSLSASWELAYEDPGSETLSGNLVMVPRWTSVSWRWRELRDWPLWLAVQFPKMQSKAGWVVEGDMARAEEEDSFPTTEGRAPHGGEEEEEGDDGRVVGNEEVR